MPCLAPYYKLNTGKPPANLFFSGLTRFRALFQLFDTGRLLTSGKQECMFLLKSTAESMPSIAKKRGVDDED